MMYPYVEILSIYHEYMQILSVKILKMKTSLYVFLKLCDTVWVDGKSMRKSSSEQSMHETIDAAWNTRFQWESEANNNERYGRMWWNKFGEFTLAQK